VGRGPRPAAEALKVALRPQAVADLEAARDWYGEAGAGLGDGFIEAVDEVFRRLVVFPRSAPRVDGTPGVRRAPVRRFPFGA
jgi:toxin ParE1/3/4